MEQEFDVARSRYFRKGQGMGHAFSFVFTPHHAATSWCPWCP